RAPALVLAGAGRGAGGGTHCGLAARPRGLLALARSLTAAGHRRGGGGHRVVVAAGVVGVLGPARLVGHGGVVSGTGLVGVGSGVRRDVVRRLGGTAGEPTLVVVGGTRRRVGGPAHSCFLTDSVRVGRNWRDLLGALDGPPAGPVRGDRGPGPGRAGGTRTHNRRFWRPVRYQLRHCPRTIPASRGPSSGACRAASSMAEIGRAHV